ncbi:protein-disulfide isomerase [Nocardioides zeae]|uniref:Protein-disulfide isomerase n=1 Tax=Nocardioides zeae TaxID=1457234 RepID=A0ACC6IN58_9ACTN|nr:thioredoxin domain-containing protein [Nocardioides zeae]MDR6173294.1 protein-disulfide isomerase [Nocardioides zeae]MDR6212192.1 protein-disulfide isomerase [Nocardioides zeae]
MAQAPGKPDGPKQSRAEVAARAQREAQRKERLREWLIVGGVVAVVAAVIIGVLALTGGDDDGACEADAPGVGRTTDDAGSDDGGSATAPGSGDSVNLAGEVTSDYGFAFGDPDAEHRVVIYEDFLCPFCGALEAASSDRLTQLVDSGDVVVEYRVFNLLGRVSDYSLRSANAMAVVMDAAGPDAAKTFHDLLYDQQPSERGPFPDDDWLVDQAVVAGADEDAVRPGIEDLAFEDWVEEAGTAATDNGVQGTPTVLVDGQQVGGATIDEITQNILDQVS